MKTIGIVAPLKSPRLRRMLDALGEVLNISFEERYFREDEGIDAWVFHKSERESLDLIAHSKRPCYVVISDDDLVPCVKSSTIEFSLNMTLPPMLRGRRINTDEAAELNSLPPWLTNATPIASKEGAPIWAIQEGGEHNHYLVGLPIPELEDGEPLFLYFFGNKFLHLLPLLLFLRELIQDKRWEPPPLQASFMFDDPNLHWRTYGYINFEEMIRHAQHHNYHASFATIPLDAWFTHMPTASLFKAHSDRISLLIHGNDHVNEELARVCSDKECDGILHQTLRRINELERRTGLEISKVMAAPHGALTEQFLQRMGQMGFEAACISRWSLRHYNKQAAWLDTIGMNPSDIIAEMPVFPRFRLSWTCQNSILVAALLHQPIIPIGHHNDIAEGLQLLANLSEYINSLGAVRWVDMKGISRSQFSRRIDGRFLRLRMFTNRIEICVPEEIQQIFVERSRWEGEEYKPLLWRALGEKMEWKFIRPDESILVRSGQHIEIMISPPISLHMDTTNPRKFQLWPILRRQLTEVRDRTSPFWKRFSMF